MGRALRTTIPIPLEQLQPKLPNSKELRKKDKEKKIMIKDTRHLKNIFLKYGYPIKEFQEKWKINNNQDHVKLNIDLSEKINMT